MKQHYKDVSIGPTRWIEEIAELRAERDILLTALKEIAEIDWETEGPTLARHAIQRSHKP